MCIDNGRQAAQLLLLLSCWWLSGCHGQLPNDRPDVGATFVHHHMHPRVKLAALGDSGQDGLHARKVAEMIQSWDTPESPLSAVLALGDVNYPRGSRLTLDTNVGQFWHRYIHPYKGRFGKGSAGLNRYWPCPGNHDYDKKQSTTGRDPLAPYLEFMPVKRRRYYDVRIGPVHCFSLDSMHIKLALNTTHPPLDASGYVADVDAIQQASWLQRRLAASSAPWKLVFFHHAPYSSGSHGSSPFMRWPFEAWGAVAVLSGHDHSYERFTTPNGFPYMVNGIGGGETYGFQAHPEVGSKWRFTSQAGGAQLIEADEHTITFKFFSTLSKQPLDCYQASRTPVVLPATNSSATNSSTTNFTATNSTASNSTASNSTSGAATLLSTSASGNSTAHAAAAANGTLTDDANVMSNTSSPGDLTSARQHHHQHGNGVLYQVQYSDCRAVQFPEVLRDEDVQGLGLVLDGVAAGTSLMLQPASP